MVRIMVNNFFLYEWLKDCMIGMEVIDLSLYDLEVGE